jgi:hypothetical protein
MNAAASRGEEICRDVPRLLSAFRSHAMLFAKLPHEQRRRDEAGMRVLWLPVLMLCAAVAGANDNPLERIAYTDPESGFAFPEMIASYQYVQSVDLGPRMGKGIHYVEIAGAKASVYVYDKEFSNLEDGLDDPRLRVELNEIDAGLAAMVRNGDYQRTLRVDVRPFSKGWRQLSHEIQLPDGQMLQSYSFMRVQNGYFVKIRVTAGSEGSLTRVPSFLLGVSRVVGMLGWPTPNR